MRLARESGQMTIEMLCLISIFLMVSLAVQRAAIGQGWVKNLIEGPWLHTQGMIENGIWGKPDATRADHPSMRDRHGSLEGSDVP